MLDNLDNLQKLLDTVDRSVVNFADMRIYTSNSLNLTTRKGMAEEVSSNKLEGIAIRALVEGAWGFASVASFDSDDVKNALDSAIKMGKGVSKTNKNKVTVNTEAVFEARNEFVPDMNPADLSFEEKMELSQRVEEVLRKHDNRIINSIGRYSEKVQREQVINTNGTNVVTDYGVFRLSGMATARSGDTVQNVSDSIATNAGLQRILDWDIEDSMTKLGSRAMKLLEAESAPSGKMNVLLEPSIVGVYIHEAFGHAAEADAIISKKSVLRDQIGKTMAIPTVNVVDDPTLEKMRGSFAYDSEGSKTQRRQIIKDGVLTGYFNDLATNDMLDEGNALNGSGRAMDFRHTVMPRMGNTYVEQGDKSFDELLESIGDGVYLQYSYGGYVNPSNGQFFFSSQSGYKIENGELTVPIKNSGMSGMTLDVLKNTIGVGNDLWIDAFPGVCGKPSLTGAQMLPVTGGGPHIAAKDIVVGGR